jgi:hypothetical protein
MRHADQQAAISVGCRGWPFVAAVKRSSGAAWALPMEMAATAKDNANAAARGQASEASGFILYPWVMG